MNEPIACLTTGSPRNQRTSRGEYCDAANCTTTSTLAITRPVKAIIPVAIEVRMSRAVLAAASGSPCTAIVRSSAGAAKPRATAPAM
jgi:hypothetical protein